MRTSGWCIGLLAALVVSLSVFAETTAVSAPIAEEEAETIAVGEDGTAPPGASQEDLPLEAPAETLTDTTTEIPVEAPAPYQTNLKDVISEDLIDLSALRSALDRPVETDVMRLTLNEAIQVAIKNNPDIIIAQFDPAKAEAETYAAGGEFDPILQQKLSYSDTTSSLDQTVRSFVNFLGSFGYSVVDSTSILSESSLAGKLHYGTQYAVQLSSNYEKGTFGNYQAEYSATLGLTLTQPLLRGFGREINRVRIRAGQNLRKISEAQARLTVMNKTADTIKAYWDLVAATENARVQEEALRNAERLMKISETRRDIGTAADIDVLQAKAGVAMRQSELIQAYARISDAGDMLKLLLNLEENGRFSKITILPVDRPNPNAATVFDTGNYDESLDLSVQRALELRPENEMSDLEIANALMEEEKARNDMLPQFDLVGSYARGGRSSEMGRTLTGILEGQDEAFSVGFQASVVLGNRAARGAHQRARINKRQAEERRKQARMAMMMRVHYAARSVLSNQALVESTRQASRLQEANVNAEERRLRIGITTSYQVLRVQEDLTAAQAQELHARIAFEKALVELQLAEGSLLENFGIHYSMDISETPVTWVQSIGFSKTPIQ
ncbi:MAG: TolC family protein [Candidatus Hydrogenedentes bacterium]|nr:TolC family protein [Candidatus Hydrogenedentota bacterium]